MTDRGGERQPETTAGVAYYQAHGRTVLHVQVPVEQWMIFAGHKLVLFYPSSAEGFEFTAKAPIEIPVVEPLLAWLDIDTVLAKAGLVQTTRDGVERWLAPKKQGPFAEVAVFRDEAGRPTRVSYSDWNSRLIGERTYEDIRAVEGGRPIPALMRSSFSRPDGVSESEEIAVGSIDWDVTIPSDVSEYKVPAGARMKKAEW